MAQPSLDHPKLPYSVVHYGKHDPDEHVGGVETFARNLRLIFEDVCFMTPANRDLHRVRRERLPTICDNHWVLDLPRGMPVIGFQHGVAAIKCELTGRRSDQRLARRQAKAAKRRDTLWVACAEWVAKTCGERHGNRAAHVVYHQVDLQRFNGRLHNQGSRLVLHDARAVNKGSKQLRMLASALPAWRFEPLACEPHEVADRMSRAAAFIHLSKYEGNSIVCNEAMAQNLPCLFTRVGLLQDEQGPTDVALVEPEVAFGDPERLLGVARGFLESLGQRSYAPREWVVENASLKTSIARWGAVMSDFAQLSWNV